MAILILALLELDVDHRLRILFLCKENSGTRSFADLLQWLDPPVAVLKRLGRLVGDQERNKASYSYTKFDINPRERRQMLAQCQLVMATGGTVSQDLTMQWSTMSGFMQDLSLMIIDEGQQRQSCCTVCPRCLNRGRWPKSPSTWTQQANGCPKWEDFSLRTGTFSTQGILTPPCKPPKSRTP